ncbi:MAG: hypothetical protein MIO92_02120 [Methanosarcinaceae archaeon]|nr:hypothetical protein [Methanosarcinaceae archaeon]
MSDETKPIPVMTRTGSWNNSCATTSKGCGDCHTCHSLGIKAGSERNVVYRNVAMYLTVGVAMVVATLVFMKILTAIFG